SQSAQNDSEHRPTWKISAWRDSDCWSGCPRRSISFMTISLFPSMTMRRRFAVSGAGLLVFSLSLVFSLIELLLDRVAVVAVITPVGRNIKANLRAIRLMRRMPLPAKGNWRARSLFYIPDKTRRRKRIEGQIE